MLHQLFPERHEILYQALSVIASAACSTLKETLKHRIGFKLGKWPPLI